MKKRKLLLTLTTVVLVGLVGCDQENPSTSSSDSEHPTVDQSFAQVLANAKKSVNIVGEYISVYTDDGEIDEEGSYDITIASDFYQTSRYYTGSYGREYDENYTFVKGDDGKIYERTLSLKNTPTDVIYKNSFNGEELNYDELCLNPFESLEIDDFYVDENGRYSVNTNAVNAFKGITILESIRDIYFFPELQVESVSFEYNNGVLSDGIISTVPQKDHTVFEWNFYYEFTFEIDFPGELDIPEVETLPSNESHEILKTALNKMHEKMSGNNYTIHAYYGDDELDSEYDTYYYGDGCYSEFHPLLYSYTQGYKLHADGKYYRYRYYLADDSFDHKAGELIYDVDLGGYYVGSKSVINSLEEIGADFSIFAPEFFKSNTANTLFTTSNRKYSEAIYNAFTPFVDKSDGDYDVRSITIELDSTTKEITSISGVAYDNYAEYEYEFTYTYGSFGSTVNPLDDQIRGGVPDKNS